MKKFGLYLMVLAIVALSVATSQAALISNYSFDNTTVNSVGTAPNGTLVGGATYAGGAIGAGALSVANTGITGSNGHAVDYVNTSANALPSGGEAFGSNTLGMWTGSTTLWVKTTDTSVPTLVRERNDTTGATHLVGLDYGYAPIGVNNAWGHLRIDSDSGSVGLGGAVNFGTTSDDTWHMLVWSWNVTTGASGTGVLTGYMDGVSKPVNIQYNTITSDATFTGPWTAGSIGSGYNTFYNEPYHGLMDDVSTWNQVITPTQAKALYNLALDTLDYGAANASKLFDLYAAGGTAVVGGQTWEKVTSGLGTTAGAVIGSNSLNLGGADGSGVRIVPIGGDVVWTGASNTTWSNTANWNPSSTPNGVNNKFDDSATGTTTADIRAANVTPTSVTFNNSSKTYTVTGASFGIAGAATVLKQGTGTTTIGSVNSYTGVTTVEAGKLILQGTGKAMAPVLTSGGANVKGGILVLDYLGEADPVTNVKSLLTASYNTGLWNTGKFQSSTATSARGLGWSDNTGTSKINVAYTLYGDANLDGTTNFTDLSKLLSKYNQTGVWSDGDFNYDGTVNFLDLSKMLSNYNQTVGTLTPSPEPSSIILLVTSVALMGGWLIRRRNRVA